MAWNDEQYRILGYAVGEVPPSYDAWFARVHPEDAAAFEAALAQARDRGVEFEHEYRILRPYGEIRWSSARGRFLYDTENHPQRMIGLMEDVTDERTAVDTQDMLIAELQHRTRNLLAIVHSIGRQTLRASSSLEEFEQEFGDRLAALSRVQALLSRGDGTSVTLAELIRGEIEAHGAELDGEKVIVSGPPVDLSSREVQVMALAFHELATNATKYGALAQPAGRLAVIWEASEIKKQAFVTIEWRESGVELHPNKHEKRGFGRELIERALGYDLQAETSFDFTADGIRCRIRAPLAGAETKEEPHGHGTQQPDEADPDRRR